MSFAEKAYVGTLDDVVARYPWDSTRRAYTLESYIKNKDDLLLKEQLLNNFNNVLQFNALFGRELLINDGYLLNHPASKLALIDPKCSPLSALIDNGRVQILRRNMDLGLEDTVIQMASQNNKSFQMLTEMDD